MSATPPPHRSRRDPLVHALPLLVIVAFASLAFWRLWPRGATHVPTTRPQLASDQVLHIWQYWWVERSLWAGQWPFRTDLLSYPAQLDLTSLWGGHLDLIVATPWVSLLGPVAASTITIALLWASTGAGIYLLAQAVTGDRVAATTAGLLYMLTPVVLGELLEGRAEQLCFGLAAPFLLHLGRWFGAGRRRDLGLALGWLLLLTCSYLGALLITAGALPALGLGYLLCPPDRAGVVAERGVFLKRGLQLAVCLAPVGLLVALYGYLALGPEHFLPTALQPASEQLSATLREWADRSLGQPSRLPIGRSFAPLPAGYPIGTALLLPLLALPALLRGRDGARRALPWALGALALYVLALGPELCDGIPSPYRLLPQVIPGFLRFHWPYRFQLMGALCLAVLCAITLQRGGAGLGARGRAARLLLPALALLLAVLQVYQLFPLPAMRVPPTPRAYDSIQAQAEGVFELSSSSGSCVYNPNLAQIHHGRPFCCTGIPPNLWSDEQRQLQKENPAYRLFTKLTYGDWPRHSTAFPSREEVASLRELGFTHVVNRDCAHGRGRRPPRSTANGAPTKRERGAAQQERLREMLGEPIIHQQLPGGELQVFELPRGAD